MPITVRLRLDDPTATYLLFREDCGWVAVPVILGASTDAILLGVKTTIMTDRRAEQS